MVLGGISDVHRTVPFFSGLGIEVVADNGRGAVLFGGKEEVL